MTKNAGAEIAFWMGIGAFVGLVPALVVAGAVMTWQLGGDLTAIDMTTAWRLSPWQQGAWGEPFESGALVGLGALVLFVAGGAALGYRPRRTAHGSARWQTRREIAERGMTRTDPMKTAGPILGKLGRPASRAPYVAVAPSQVHTVVAAPTGSGKGVGCVIPTLLTYPGSVVVLDIKGENHAETARARVQLGDKVFRFAPGEARSHRFNPLAALAELPEVARFEAARGIAASLLVPVSKGQEGFVGGARDIFAAAALLAVERGTPTIAAIHDMLNVPGSGEQVFGRLAAEAQAPAARGILGRMAATEGRILDAYKSVLFETGLTLWAFDTIRGVTEASDFDFDDLRRKPASIYLVVPSAKLQSYAPLMRLMLRTLVDTLQARLPGADERYPVLFVMDEFSSLGDMGDVPQTMTSIRGYGGRFMIIVTQLADLVAVYGEAGKERILGNADVQLFMATNDGLTPKHVAESIGPMTRRARSTSWSTADFRTSHQERDEGAPLIRPDELRRLPEDEAIVLVRGADPIRVRKVRYFADRGLRGLHAAQAGVKLPELPALGATPPKEAARGPAATSLADALVLLEQTDRAELLRLMEEAIHGRYGTPTPPSSTIARPATEQGAEVRGGQGAAPVHADTVEVSAPVVALAEPLAAKQERPSPVKRHATAGGADAVLSRVRHIRREIRQQRVRDVVSDHVQIEQPEAVVGSETTCSTSGRGASPGQGGRAGLIEDIRRVRQQHQTRAL